MPPRRPIKVLVVDDSAVVRRLITEALSVDPDIEVVGTASDPYMAKDRIKELSPDVLTLDLEMPRMDGLTFLGILMRERPMPVIVMSSISKEGSVHAMEALRLGAVEVLAKPGGSYSFGDMGPRLHLAVKAAATARLKRPGVALPPPPAPSASRPGFTYAAPPQPRAATTPYRGDSRRLIVLGASTGGTEALREVLVRLPAGLPPIAIVQHIPANFSRAFAERLDSLCAFPVHEAVDGDALPPGTALVAPGNFHMLVRWTGAGYRVELNSGPQVWHQRPAVDILFKSVPEANRPHTIGGVLTGMGKDGAEGLVRLRKSGASTFAQDEATSVVYGMPREAWVQGGAEVQLPLDAIADHIVLLATQSRLSHASA
ncbi:MAG: chemotaxis response regulator protein-glutamate methylesterase [Verrucomicrobia bacterium]|nr:chemotaxis response regulator protein-glutamate methylesterase [Verrucomicrobiota bacterium]